MLLVRVTLLVSWLSCYSISNACEEGVHANSSEREGDILLCRSCGYEIASSSDLKFIASKLALAQRNDTVIGDQKVTLQLFENPHGRRFQVITLKKAELHKHWPADSHFTWFPGFSWTMSTCPRCHAHLGWSFQPSNWPDQVTEKHFEESEETFVALIIDKLLQENFAATLLVLPRTFRS
ncbi:hypothetical protein AOXY_G26848 [Acipenser oxyrinchus oxyrinchus]|uniref:CULT domain-containing protein n=1 Tax=Acipenser oxyrinchus oxyrinchus TaxID=40147 RepID=A0AAD8FXK0_ACIOX|nr:hypothetical protein AOXY_G26848 [Acipenser oxyrinchus oxyrinchus]